MATFNLLTYSVNPSALTAFGHSAAEKVNTAVHSIKLNVGAYYIHHNSYILHIHIYWSDHPPSQAMLPHKPSLCVVCLYIPVPVRSTASSAPKAETPSGSIP